MEPADISKFASDFLHELENAHVLDLTDTVHLPPGTVVRLASDDGTWIRFEIINNQSGVVQLTCGEVLGKPEVVSYATPVAGEALGTLLCGGILTGDVADHGLLKVPSVMEQHQLLRGQVRKGEVFVYKVGQSYHVINGVLGLMLTLVSGRTLDLWDE